MFINQMMTVRPGTIFRERESRYLLMFPLVPLFIVIVMLWVQVFRAHSIQFRFVITGMFVAILHLTAGFFYQKQELDTYRDVLKNAYIEKYGSFDAEYIRNITTGITIHVNNQYFNGNTFFMFLTSSIFVASLFYLLQRWEED